MEGSPDVTENPARDDDEAVRIPQFLDAAQKALIDELSGRLPIPPSRTQPESDWELDVNDDPEHSKFEASINQDAIADLTYERVGRRLVLLFTFVDEAYRGRGVVTELIAKALDMVRKAERTVTVVCPIVREFIDRYPVYGDLVDLESPGLPAGVIETLEMRPTEPRASTMTRDEDDEITPFERDLG